jgi:hypothetical protein
MSRLWFARVTWGICELGVISAFFVLVPLLLTGCDRSDKSEVKPVATATNSPVKKEGNYITAAPNPVPPGPGLGKATISWRTKDIPSTQVHVYIVAEDGKEMLFSIGAEGSQEAPWIAEDRPYEFRLYQVSGSDRKLLDKVIVERK